MKKAIFLPGILLLVCSLYAGAQITVSTSSLTGVKLPTNTYRETNSSTITKTVTRMDSLTSLFNISIDKQYPELLYVNADSLFIVLKKYGFTVKNVNNANLFEITKSTYRFMAYKSSALTFSPSAICLARRK
jgi:hypothetical protein